MSGHHLCRQSRRRGRGVSAYPAEVTEQMVANFQQGGAAINALARACGAHLTIIPLDLDRPTGDISEEPAMSEAECLAALNAGAGAVDPRADLLFVGEMGIGNTTLPPPLRAGLWRHRARLGRGTGVDAPASPAKFRGRCSPQSARRTLPRSV
jgi:nicotinate-nucleotide--dimethylbenzimidazole phosphoribosyltransferase